MLFFNCTSCFLVLVYVVFIIELLEHGHGFVSVKWLDGRESLEAEYEVLDACAVSAINFTSEDQNEYVILESSTHQPHTTDYVDISEYSFSDYSSDYVDISGFVPDLESVDLISTTYCQVVIRVPLDQNINVTVLDADNNDVPSYLYVEKHCSSSSCLDR